jgi:hypothetical protein
MCRTPGGPAHGVVQHGERDGVVTPGACSKGVQTVSKSSGAITLR